MPGQIDIFADLRSHSVFITGKRIRSRIIWSKVYETTNEIDQEEMRSLLHLISNHILKGRIRTGAARKFMDGKLLYQSISENEEEDQIYCLFTKQMEQHLESPGGATACPPSQLM